MSRFCLVLLLTACGGSSAPAAAPDPAEEGAASAGKQCLEDASAPREPKANAPEAIEVSHILVRHAELKRPQGATRSREQACLRALEARNKLQASGDWDAVVSEYSDAPGATGGALGRVSADELDPAFASAAFALDVDELSYVVETERGFHIILRTD